MSQPLKSTDNPGKVISRIALACGAVLVLIVGTAAVWLALGMPNMVGPLTLAAAAPKAPPVLVIPPGGVVYGVVLLLSAILLWIGREVRWALKAGDMRNAAKDAAQPDIDALTRKLADTQAVLKVAQATANARTQNFLDQQYLHNKTRQELREEIELEWQRDTKAEIEREHARYLGYVERQRITKAEHEAAKLARARRLLQLEEMVLAIHPDFAQRTDPIGKKEPEVVAAAFRKQLEKKVPDIGLLRYSADPEVLSKLGSLADFPPAPLPIGEPVLIPVPEILRKRFEGQQVR